MIKKLLQLALACLLLTSNCLSLSDDFFSEGSPDFSSVLANEETVVFPRFDLLAKVLSPSVVNISAESNSGKDASKESKEEKSLPFFKEPKPGKSLGSGFILSKSGFIATNNHVVQKADKIIVRLLDDRKKYEAVLIGVDEKTDIALIKINTDKELVPAFIGNSDDIDVGEWVLAIGNQFQLGQTVTAGILSAKSRKVQAAGPYDNFLQTDASINPGSSGGPLFNDKGQVIGINTAIYSPGRSQFGGQGFNIGIGFAIPINMARVILNQLKNDGKVTRGLLGVIIQNIDQDLAMALGGSALEGALVADVIDDTPAGKAGFKVKDIIVSYDGAKVFEHDDLPIMVANTPVGATVPVEVVRGGKKILLYPTITELSPSKFDKVPVVKTDKVDRIGLTVQDLTSELAESFGIDSVGGLIVKSVEANSPAFKAGIVRGDIIKEVANKKVLSEEAFAEMIKNLPSNTPILILVEKREGTRFLTLKIEE